MELEESQVQIDVNRFVRAKLSSEATGHADSRANEQQESGRRRAIGTNTVETEHIPVTGIETVLWPTVFTL